MNIDTTKSLQTMPLNQFKIVDRKDISKINIDEGKPVMQRLVNFVVQIGDPYSFRVGKTPVKVVFSKRYAHKSIEVCLEKIVRSIAQ